MFVSIHPFIHRRRGLFYPQDHKYICNTKKDIYIYDSMYLITNSIWIEIRISINNQLIHDHDSRHDVWITHWLQGMCSNYMSKFYVNYSLPPFFTLKKKWKNMINYRSIRSTTSKHGQACRQGLSSLMHCWEKVDKIGAFQEKKGEEDWKLNKDTAVSVILELYFLSRFRRSFKTITRHNINNHYLMIMNIDTVPRDDDFFLVLFQEA